MKTLVVSQFIVMSFHEFHTNGNSSEDNCWVSVLSYLSLRVSNKREILWRHFLCLSSKFSRFTSLKNQQIFMKTLLESQFEVIEVYIYQTKADSYKDISWASARCCVSFWVSNKSQFLRRHILGLSLKLRKFMSSIPKRILLRTFVESKFEVM